jgi:hypothetical protein
MMDQPENYRIRLRDQLDTKWVAWFDGMTVSTDVGDGTILFGPVQDQAALHGLLAKVRDLGLTLISVECAEPNAEDRSIDIGPDKQMHAERSTLEDERQPFDWPDDDEESSELGK